MIMSRIRTRQTFAVAVTLLLTCSCVSHAEISSGQQSHATSQSIEQPPQPPQPQPSPPLSGEVHLPHGILKPLPRTYQPPQPEPMVAPPVDSQTQQRQQQQQHRHGADDSQQGDSKGPTRLSAEEPHHPSKDPLVEQLKEEIKHLHHRLHYERHDEHREDDARAKPPEHGYRLSPEQPHHIDRDPLVQQLKEEIKHLHHRLHHEKHLTPFEREMYGALDKVLAKIKRRQQHVAEVQVQVDLLRNLTQQMLTTPTKLDTEVLEAASKLLQICSSSAHISQKPSAHLKATSDAHEEEQPHQDLKERSKQAQPKAHTHRHQPEASGEESDFIDLMPAPRHSPDESAAERHEGDEAAYQQAYERARHLRVDQGEQRKHLHPRSEHRRQQSEERDPHWLEKECRRRQQPHSDEPDGRYHEPGEDHELAAFRRVAVEPLQRGWTQISAFARDQWQHLQDAIFPLRRRRDRAR